LHFINTGKQLNNQASSLNSALLGKLSITKFVGNAQQMPFTSSSFSVVHIQ